MVNNYERDGSMRTDGNGGANTNYFPNSFDDIVVDESYKEPAVKLGPTTADWFDRNEHDNDHYTQPGNLYRNAMNDAERKNTVDNIVKSMRGITGEKKAEITNRQLCHFFRADVSLGMAVAKGLGVSIDEKSMAHAQ